MVKRILVLFVTLCVAFGAVSALVWLGSPERSMLTMLNDTKKDGLNGLRPHLTEEACQTLDELLDKAENNSWLKMIPAVAKDGIRAVVEAEIHKVVWTLGEIQITEDRATVPIGFNYESKIAGTVRIQLIRDGWDWKVSGIGNLSIDKLALFNS